MRCRLDFVYVYKDCGIWYDFNFFSLYLYVSPVCVDPGLHRKGFDLIVFYVDLNFVLLSLKNWVSNWVTLTRDTRYDFFLKRALYTKRFVTFCNNFFASWCCFWTRTIFLKGSFFYYSNFHFVVWMWDLYRIVKGYIWRKFLEFFSLWKNFALKDLIDPLRILDRKPEIVTIKFRWFPSYEIWRHRWNETSLG